MCVWRGWRGGVQCNLRVRKEDGKANVLTCRQPSLFLSWKHLSLLGGWSSDQRKQSLATSLRSRGDGTGVETWQVAATCLCVSTTATTAARALRGNYRTFSEPESHSLAAAQSAGHFGGRPPPLLWCFYHSHFLEKLHCFRMQPHAFCLGRRGNIEWLN